MSLKEFMKNSIVITGAAQRIGLFLTDFFLKKEYNVIAVVRKDSDELIELKNQYPLQLVIEYKDFLIDTMDIDFWEKYKTHQIGGFIHCASIFKYDNIITATKQSQLEHEKVNCDVFVDACVSYMKTNIGEQISCIAFLDAKVEKLNPDHFSYTLSKLKLKSAIEFLSMTGASKIRVNAISPDLTLPSGNQTNKDFKRVKSKLPLKVTPSLVEIANLALFLIETKSITNQNIVIDGGQNLISNQDIIFQ